MPLDEATLRGLRQKGIVQHSKKFIRRVSALEQRVEQAEGRAIEQYAVSRERNVAETIEKYE